MIAATRRKQIKHPQRPLFSSIGTIVGITLLLLGVFLSSHWFHGSSALVNVATTLTTIETGNDSNEGSIGATNIKVNLQQGSVGGVSHYYCATTRIANGKNHYHHLHPTRQLSLVLLHGAKFTKEDWKSSGILTMFCASTHADPVALSVVALDLPVEATHQDLAQALDALAIEKLVTIPLTLVTPSASGKCMVDWLRHEETSSYRLEQYVRRWIPIASGAIQQLRGSDVVRVASTLFILAIYGDRDKSGKILSERLQEMASPNAHLLEIEGGHPCYLESPSIFVKAVVDFMTDTTKGNFLT